MTPSPRLSSLTSNDRSPLSLSITQSPSSPHRHQHHRLSSSLVRVQRRRAFKHPAVPVFPSPPELNHQRRQTNDHHPPPAPTQTITLGVTFEAVSDELHDMEQ
ncbi:hypothetical protein D9611_001356 [Ephemerocybe angulata]|uniref:Uncharacterized protein n=1 Tax=Ephemerocybe angulata TaxID=980116 RepID=A0A8H5CI05_9AGAR|nr:hypothetical protein D9611_001356 [Tulosesus angulatus]